MFFCWTLELCLVGWARISWRVEREYLARLSKCVGGGVHRTRNSPWDSVFGSESANVPFPLYPHYNERNQVIHPFLCQKINKNKKSSFAYSSRTTTSSTSKMKQTRFHACAALPTAENGWTERTSSCAVFFSAIYLILIYWRGMFCSFWPVQTQNFLTHTDSKEYYIVWCIINCFSSLFSSIHRDQFAMSSLPNISHRNNYI